MDISQLGLNHLPCENYCDLTIILRCVVPTTTSRIGKTPFVHQGLIVPGRNKEHPLVRILNFVFWFSYRFEEKSVLKIRGDMSLLPVWPFAALICGIPLLLAMSPLWLGILQICSVLLLVINLMASGIGRVSFF